MTYAIDVHLGPDDLETALRSDVLAGLTTRPLTLPPKWFYDDLGSRLFDAITVLPQYYPTRCETQILRTRAAEVSALAAPDTLVELGSGTSTKTRILLDALTAAGTLRRFVPMDVSENTLRLAVEALTELYPELEMHAVVGDFERHLMKLPGGERRLVAFLGGTIGNLEPAGRAAFLDDLASVLEPGDSLLLGTDLVKPADILLAAYDDPAGVTAAFNRNVLNVLNRRLTSDFDARRFEHVARWDPAHEWIEMHLRSTTEQQVRLHDVDVTVDLSAGETIRTEISAKFRRESVTDELARAGFELRAWWTDEDHQFALSLSTRA